MYAVCTDIKMHKLVYSTFKYLECVINATASCTNMCSSTLDLHMLAVAFWACVCTVDPNVYLFVQSWFECLVLSG